MPVRFAKSYVDRLFAEKDIFELHWLISVIEQDRPLSEEFWLFCRVVEWMSSTRSGVWQYYECLPEETYQRISRALDRFGLDQIAEKFRFGHIAWKGPDQAATLDKWIDQNEQQIKCAAFNLILPRKNFLTEEN